MYQLVQDGRLSTVPFRTISLNLGTGDTEGIVWLYGDRYAIASEESGEILVVSISDDPNASWSFGAVRRIDTGIRDGNRGIEGVGFNRANGHHFYLVKEKPPELFRIDWSHNGSRPTGLALPGISDASDLYVANDGTIVVLSDESNEVVQFSVDDSFTRVERISSMSLPSGFEQPEGVAFDSEMERMHIVGEASLPGSVRYGHFQN